MYIINDKKVCLPGVDPWSHVPSCMYLINDKKIYVLLALTPGVICTESYVPNKW